MMEVLSRTFTESYGSGISWARCRNTSASRLRRERAASRECSFRLSEFLLNRKEITQRDINLIASTTGHAYHKFSVESNLESEAKFKSINRIKSVLRLTSSTPPSKRIRSCYKAKN